MLSTIALLAAVSVSPHMGIAVTPAQMTGPANSQATYRVTDMGNVGEHIVIQVVEMRPVTGSKALVPYGEWDHYRTSPAEFDLKAGQSKSVKVTVNSTDGFRHVLGVYAEASTAKAGNGAGVKAEVAGQFVVTGKPNPYAPSALSQPQAPSHGTSPVLPVGILAGLSVALLSVWRILRRRHRRTA